jgi:hypothetical protein
MKRTDRHKESYQVPEGYFDQIKQELKSIPQQKEGSKVIHLQPSWKIAIAVAAGLVIAISLFWPQKDPLAYSDAHELATYMAEEAYLDFYTTDIVDAYLDWSNGTEVTDFETVEGDYLYDHYSINEILNTY